MKVLGCVRARAILILKLTVAALLLFWLFSSGRIEPRALLDASDRWPWLLLAQLTFGLTQVLSGLRWQLLLRIQDIEYKFSSAWSLTLAGIFFNQVLIGSTGGDLYKAYAVASDNPDKKAEGITSVFVDRGIGLAMLLMLVPIAFLWNATLVRVHPELIWFITITLLILLVMAALTLLYFAEPLRRQVTLKQLVSRLPMAWLLKRLDTAAYAYRANQVQLARVALISLVIQLLIIYTNILLAYALLGGGFEWIPFLLLVPIAHLTMAIPINPPGALGTAEAVYAYLFALIGISEGALLCILQRLTFIIWAIPGAVAYIARKRPMQTLRG